MKKKKTVLLFVILLLVPGSLLLAPKASAQTITGQIFDAITGDSIPFAALRYRGHKISMASNYAGKYSIERHNGWKLTFSAIGYENESIDIDEDTPAYINISLMPKSNLLTEVTVKGKRHRYRRKENPAVELMRRVISAKKRTNLDNNPYYEYLNYQKITLALNDIKPAEIQGSFGKKNKWLVDQVEPCVYNNKLILPVSLDETVTRHIYRRSPQSQKDIIVGQRSQGINQVIQTGELVNVVMRDAFTDVDIYDDNIRLLRHYFTSPIGRDAIAFYRYYIIDTVKVDRDSCYHLEFLPNNQQDLGFRGELYILKDTTLHVKRCNMTLQLRQRLCQALRRPATGGGAASHGTCPDGIVRPEHEERLLIQPHRRAALQGQGAAHCRPRCSHAQGNLLAALPKGGPHPERGTHGRIHQEHEGTAVVPRCRHTLQDWCRELH